MEMKIASSEADLRRISPVLLQLRTQYTQDSLVAQIQLQQQRGYQVAYVEHDDDVLCVIGFVMSSKLSWGKNIYIDDLVTNESARSTGAGKFAIDWFKNHCKENGCQQLHLDSGVTRFSAHKFYLREGFSIASHHFAVREIE